MFYKGKTLFNDKIELYETFCEIKDLNKNITNSCLTKINPYININKTLKYLEDKYNEAVYISDEIKRIIDYNVSNDNYSWYDYDCKCACNNFKNDEGFLDCERFISFSKRLNKSLAKLENDDILDVSFKKRIIEIIKSVHCLVADISINQRGDAVVLDFGNDIKIAICENHFVYGFYGAHVETFPDLLNEIDNFLKKFNKYDSWYDYRKQEEIMTGTNKENLIFLAQRNNK